ncbi:hypothetical protein [Alkalihalobacterium chitinilyticum]|uniref:DUF1795 domain-containing protein n=1 Tax=Alkalihalobacterium chitinilyticum TaxID=2980103 RepID=A0ABT5VI68_9BACI|nr:hypothetical protein [Alkalihalobacterium chitinilyticum]MDE5415143.1 hypothetical protein [Alkalihalobacterium chitinilyticum]
MINFKTLIILIILAGGLMTACSTEESEEPVNDATDESINVEPDTLSKSYDLAMGLTVAVPGGQGVALQEPEVQPTPERAYVASLVSDDPMSGCPEEYSHIIELPQRPLLIENWVDPITDECYQSIMGHPYGGSSFNITRKETNLTNHSVEEAKERHVSVAQHAGEISEIDLSEHPELDDFYDYYLKIDGVYQEDDLNHDRLTGKPFTAHLLVAWEDRTQYLVAYYVNEEQHSEDVLNTFFDIAASVKFQ